jgi:hypothetical protein
MPIITQGEIHGKVSLKSSGDGGFGYDKVFYPRDMTVQWPLLILKLKIRLAIGLLRLRNF